MRDGYKNAMRRREQTYRSPSVVVKSRAPSSDSKATSKTSYNAPLITPAGHPKPALVHAQSAKTTPLATPAATEASVTTKIKPLPTQPIYSTRGIPATPKSQPNYLENKPLPTRQTTATSIQSVKPAHDKDRINEQPIAANQVHTATNPPKKPLQKINPATLRSTVNPREKSVFGKNNTAKSVNNMPSKKQTSFTALLPPPPPTPENYTAQPSVPQPAIIRQLSTENQATGTISATLSNIAIDTPEKPQKKLTMKKRKRSVLTPAAGFYATAAVFAGFGSFVIIQSLQSNQEVEQQADILRESTRKTTANAAILASSDQVPDQKEPEQPDYREIYKVGPKLPRIIRIPSLSVYARVLQAGIDKSSTIMTPASVYDTAWYTGSSRPGEEGASVINGHVGLPQGYGVFKNIKNLKNGAIIEIEKGDEVKKQYRVTSVTTVDTEKINMEELLKANGNGTELNLITCGGSYDAKANEYEKRTIVRSTLVR